MANPVNLRAIVGVIDKATAPLRGIGRGFAGLGLQARLAAANINRLARQTGISAMIAQLGNAGRAGLALTRQLGEIAMKAAEIAGVGVLGGLAGLGEMLRSFAERGDSAAKAAARFGMSVREYQEYAHVAKEADIEEGSFGKGLRKLTVGIAEAAGGKNKELASLFRHMGINVRDARGHLRSTADILPQVAEAFRRNENPTLRMAMAAALFGEKNVQLIDLLVQGREALEKGREEARRYGTAMNEEQVKAAQALDDGYKHVQMSVTGIANAIGGKLGPVVAPMLESFADWIAANREIVSADIGEAVTGIASAIRGFDWRGFGKDLKEIGGDISAVIRFFGGWKNAAIALAVILNAELILATFELAKSLGLVSVQAAIVAWRLGAIAFGAVAAAAMNFVTALRAGYGAMAALNLVMAANPLGLVVLGIAAVIAMGVLLWKNWDRVKSAWSGLQSWIESGLDALSRKFQPFIDALKFAMKWSPVGLLAQAGSIAFNVGASVVAPAGGQSLLGGRGLVAANAGAAQAARSPAPGRSEVRAVVDFNNVPPGVSVRTQAQGPVKTEMNVGRAMHGMGRQGG